MIAEGELEFATKLRACMPDNIHQANEIADHIAGQMILDPRIQYGYSAGHANSEIYGSYMAWQQTLAGS